ncbi:DNA-binding response OmpR family regulator [Variovorax ginsengisoli]|uniref:DNA-binding response OmpR family regulator n=2 Tax=Variovorax ginsengisoli TaxID=363844 RepID=A0ABT9S7N5_9BURK|nr:DNA-binding response OmpR family regulator [Variovorax ginsengisoli]
MDHLGHEFHPFQESRPLLRELRDQNYDLLILDWSLPDRYGLAILRWLRKALHSRMPVLFIADCCTEEDIVEGLSAGADEFVGKPVRAGELAARVLALLRRAYPAQHETELVFGVYRFSPQVCALELRGQPIDLKHREYELAMFLFQNMGRLLSRERLREAVWGNKPAKPSRSLDTHISRLRSKLDLCPANGFLLSAIYGLGYRLESMDDDLMRIWQFSGVQRTV